jgi:hypothetical protein
MFKAFARVAARSVAIQLEEAAATARARQPYVNPTPKIHQYNAANKGKGKGVEKNFEEPPSLPSESVVSRSLTTQQTEGVKQEDVMVASKTLPLPDTREARQEIPYIFRRGEDVPPTSSSKPPVLPEISASSEQPEPIVASDSTSKTPVVERKVAAPVTPEPNPVELDEASIEPSQVIDDVDAETVSEVARRYYHQNCISCSHCTSF